MEISTIWSVFSLFFLFSGKPRPTDGTRNPLVVTVTGYENKQAQLHVALFRPEGGFPKNAKNARGFSLRPNGKQLATLTVSDVDYGDYAVAIFQDLNGNGQLDTNFIGIPKEPYCFSNNFAPMRKMRAPRFEDCRFQYSAAQHELVLHMLNN